MGLGNRVRKENNKLRKKWNEFLLKKPVIGKNTDRFWIHEDNYKGLGEKGIYLGRIIIKNWREGRKNW